MAPSRTRFPRQPARSATPHVLTAYAATFGAGRFLVWRCIVLYPLLVVACALVLQTDVARTRVLEPSNVATAHMGAWLIGLSGQHVSVSGEYISYGGRVARVGTGCSGAELMMVLLPAILVFPSSLRAKAVGVVAAAAFVFPLNAVRVGSLSVLLATNERLFELSHLYFWQALLIACLVAFFLAWLEVSRRYSTLARSG